jgi:hypothetical protein
MKVIKLKESDIQRMVKRVLNENVEEMSWSGFNKKINSLEDETFTFVFKKKKNKIEVYSVATPYYDTPDYIINI